MHCDNCGVVPVPYEELPLRLPKVENFEPGVEGESPLAKIDSFVKCKCPKCGRDARRRDGYHAAVGRIFLVFPALH